MSLGKKLMGISLCILGWIMAIVACALPKWRVTASRNGNGPGMITWEGLWMACVAQTTEQMRCKVYNSLRALSQDLLAARALTVMSILLALLAVLIAIVGAKCTNCIESSKAKLMIVSGVFFIGSGVMQLVPISWTTITIIRDFYGLFLVPNPRMELRTELGVALYIGWAAAALLILGGGLLCFSCPPRKTKYDHLRMSFSKPGLQLPQA